MEKGVGRKPVASDGHTTDAVYSLQAGKTVDISRVAAESTDLLSAFSTASATSWPAASPPTRPAAGRLAAAAAHRAAVVDCSDIGGGVNVGFAVFVLFQTSGCIAIHNIDTYAIGGALLYREKIYLFHSAIGALETFDDSRLTAKKGVSGMRMSCKARSIEHSTAPER